MIERVPAIQRKLNIPTFENYYPQGQVELLNYEQLPTPFMEGIERDSLRPCWKGYGYVEKDFHFYGRVIHSNNTNDVTYFAHQDRTFHLGDPYAKEANAADITYTVDYVDGEKMGYSRVQKLFTQNLPIFEYPFIDYVQTEEKFQRNGYGMRRLFMLNALCQATLRQPLCSSSLRSEEASILWNKLYERGYAIWFSLRQYSDKFRFIDKF